MQQLRTVRHMCHTIEALPWVHLHPTSVTHRQALESGSGMLHDSSMSRYALLWMEKGSWSPMVAKYVNTRMASA